jgi:predicted DNA-binding WGR domain protein
MADYMIRRRFAHHTGGTKAYQVYEIQMNGAAAVVFQFGKFSTGMDPTKMGGTVDIAGVFEPSVAKRRALDKEKEKSKRGYQDWDTDDCSFANESELFATVVSLLGGQKANQIRIALEADEASKPAPAPDPDNSGKGKAKAPATEELLPEWGTW